MEKIDATVFTTLIKERDRLTSKAKAQSEKAQETLNQANSLSATISKLKEGQPELAR